MITIKKSHPIAAAFMTVLLGLTLTAVNPVDALAERKIEIGPLKVYPGFSYSVQYNDNIFADDDDEDTEDDYIHTFTPSIRFELGNGLFGITAAPGRITRGRFRNRILGVQADETGTSRGQINSGVGDLGVQVDETGKTRGAIGIENNYLSLGYSIDFAEFTDFSENDFRAHNLFLSSGVTLPPGERFYITFDDQFTDTADPYGTEDYYNVGDRTDRWENIATVIFGYRLPGKHTVELLYENFIREYEERIDEWQNRIDHSYGVSLYREITAKIAVFARYLRTDAEYDEQNDGVLGWTSNTSRDYILDDYYVGLRFVPTRRLAGEVAFGWGEQSFDNSYDKFGREYVDQDSWIARTSVSYRLGARTVITYVLERSLEGSPDADAAAYVDTLMALYYDQRLTERFNINFGAEWDRNEYSDENPGLPEKYYDTYTGTAGFNVRIFRWMTAGMSYIYELRNASDEIYEDDEYENHILSVRSSMSF